MDIRIFCKSSTQRDLVLSCIRDDPSENFVVVPFDEGAAYISNISERWVKELRHMAIRVEEITR